jgi:5-methylcytosine-specific restriction endonuclease McrA
VRVGRYQDLFPPQVDYRGRYLCRVCREILPGRLRSFCSDACKDAALIRCWPSEAARQVGKRDRGVCSRCGVDAGAMSRAFWRWYSIRVRHGGIAGVNRLQAWFCGRGWPATSGRIKWWEAHHKVPVVEGGGLCGLDGLETLCSRCHRAETAALAKRRAEARRTGVVKEQTCS